MNGKPAVHVPEVPGIDLDYRPRNYFLAADLNISLLSGVAGETRRQLIRGLIEEGNPIPAGLDAPVLKEETRQAWGRVHPSMEHPRVGRSQMTFKSKLAQLVASELETHSDSVGAWVSAKALRIRIA
jgi:hypothetical protein